MEEVSSKDMRTVLFVSHNLSAITSLCAKVILLDKGRAPLPIASTEVAMQEYLGTNRLKNIYIASEEAKTQKAWIEKAEIIDETGTTLACMRVGMPLIMTVNYICKQPIHNLGIGVGISIPGGPRITSFNNYITGASLPGSGKDSVFVEISINDLRLAPGIYTVSLSLVENETEWLDLQSDCISFSVFDDGFYHAGRSLTKDQALVWCKPTFSITQSSQ
jgi:lipopolysaccharide transport system ATP-binding protein